MVQDESQTGPLRSFLKQRMMRPGNGRAGVSRISVLSSGRCQGSNVWMPFGGQTPPVKAVRPTSRSWAGNSATLKIGPEPGDEEHHLRGDEQDHPVAVRDLHHAGVVALDLASKITSRHHPIIV